MTKIGDNMVNSDSEVPLLDTAERRKKYVHDTLRSAGAKPRPWGPDGRNTGWDVDEITPAMAAKLLPLRHNQRSMKEPVAKKYTTDIKDEQWAVTGEPIIFDKDWYLIEGQHRFEGCVRAQKSIVHVRVVMTTDPRANRSTGTGTKNTVADLIRKECSDRVPTTVISAILMEIFDFGRVPDTLSAPETAKLVIDYDLRSDAIALYQIGKKTVRLTAGALAAALRGIRNYGADAMRFYSQAFSSNQEIDGRNSKASRSLSLWMVTQYDKYRGKDKAGRQARHTTGFVREFEAAEHAAREFLRWKNGDRRETPPAMKGVMPEQFVPTERGRAINGTAGAKRSRPSTTDGSQLN